MKLSTIRSRSTAAALFLTVAVAGAACAEGDDAVSVGQEAAEESGQEAAEETGQEAAEESAESTEAGEEAADGDATARVGAKYAANVFTLVGTDATEDGRIVAITDGATEVRTADTVTYVGEVVDFTDPKVAEVLGEDQYEALEVDLGTSQVLLISSLEVR